MKKVEAIIRQSKLDEVKAELARRVIAGMTVTEVRGFGRHEGRPGNYRGTQFEYTLDLLPNVKVEVVIPDNYLHSVLDIIQHVTRTGKFGDGKIFISDLSSVVRIRTGETNENAI
ncbi:MAG TPA: P-II family nitrogen regulator [Pirellulales bacterium]|nr:P-II family nitrogen regulator [Pirellulales bacterium]